MSAQERVALVGQKRSHVGMEVWCVTMEIWCERQDIPVGSPILTQKISNKTDKYGEMPVFPRKITFQDYWEAIHPADPELLKERILRSADLDPNIGWREFQRLVARAYPEFC